MDRPEPRKLKIENAVLHFGNIYEPTKPVHNVDMRPIFSAVFEVPEDVAALLNMEGIYSSNDHGTFHAKTDTAPLITAASMTHYKHLTQALTLRAPGICRQIICSGMYGRIWTY